MKIDSYSFGAMTIDGRTYKSDLILHSDRIDDGWRRKQGHHCCLADLSAALQINPGVLIIGTGDSGLMPVGDDLRDHCRKNKIELIVLPTARAVAAYNGCPNKASAIAAFHLTC
ncbi:MAG: MTH938/NDUFAF3 family protein [Candidatus Edwardsbacteria bacterium]|nr:MTH938/NDUFAF3 family protein [Candidatus Edwardsbacteria bacterium]